MSFHMNVIAGINQARQTLAHAVRSDLESDRNICVMISLMNRGLCIVTGVEIDKQKLDSFANETMLTLYRIASVITTSPTFTQRAVEGIRI